MKPPGVMGLVLRTMNGLMATLVGLAALLLAVLWVVYRPALVVPQPSTPLEELRDIGELRARFNQDVGSPRLVLLLSPT